MIFLKKRGGLCGNVRTRNRAGEIPDRQNETNSSGSWFSHSCYRVICIRWRVVRSMQYKEDNTKHVSGRILWRGVESFWNLVEAVTSISPPRFLIDDVSSWSRTTLRFITFVPLVNKWVSLHKTPLFFHIITSLPLIITIFLKKM